MIEGHAVFQFEITIDHFKAIVRHRVGQAVTSVDVSGTQRPDGRTCGVLIDRIAIKSQISRRFIDIAHIDSKGLGGRQTTRIGRGHNHVDRGGVFMVERYTVFQFQVAIDHFKAIVRHRVGQAVTGVDVCGTQGANRRTCGVLSHRCAVERQVGRRFVDITHIDGEGLGSGQTTAISRRYRHVDRGGVFMVERHAVFQFQVAIDHLKAGIADRVGQAVTGVDVCGIQRANRRTCGVFSHRCAVERQIGRRFVHIIHVNGEGLSKHVTRTVHHGYTEIN